MALEREVDSAENQLKEVSLAGAVMASQPLLWIFVFCCSTPNASIT